MENKTIIAVLCNCHNIIHAKVKDEHFNEAEYKT